MGRYNKIIMLTATMFLLSGCSEDTKLENESQNNVEVEAGQKEEEVVLEVEDVQKEEEAVFEVVEEDKKELLEFYNKEISTLSKDNVYVPKVEFSEDYNSTSYDEVAEVFSKYLQGTTTLEELGIETLKGNYDTEDFLNLQTVKGENYIEKFVEENQWVMSIDDMVNRLDSEDLYLYDFDNDGLLEILDLSYGVDYRHNVEVTLIQLDEERQVIDYNTYWSTTDYGVYKYKNQYFVETREADYGENKNYRSRLFFFENEGSKAIDLNFETVGYAYTTNIIEPHNIVEAEAYIDILANFRRSREFVELNGYFGEEVDMNNDGVLDTVDQMATSPAASPYQDVDFLNIRFTDCKSNNVVEISDVYYFDGYAFKNMDWIEKEGKNYFIYLYEGEFNTHNYKLVEFVGEEQIVLQEWEIADIEKIVITNVNEQLEE